MSSLCKNADLSTQSVASTRTHTHTFSVNTQKKHYNKRQHAHGENSKNTCKKERDRDRENYRVRGIKSLKEKPPTWRSYIRTTGGKLKCKFRVRECIMQLGSVLLLNTNLIEFWMFKINKL